MSEKKENILIVLGLFVLVALIVGVSYAFFNYTRTGAVNTVRVGEINFNSTQETITLTNVFPTSSDNLNSSNSATATITITGNTTYNSGMEYKVTLEDVHNEVNGKIVPISLNISADNLGTKSDNYWNARGGNTSYYDYIEENEVLDEKYIFVGYIKPDTTGVNGTIDITAFIDKDKVAISDTWSGNESNEMGTPNSWRNERRVFGTEEWNSLNNKGLSFRIKVEAQEGVWVEKENVLKRLPDVTEWNNIKNSITSIEFSSSLEIPNNAILTFDATDTSYMGEVKVYTLDDEKGNNTYKAIICADDDIYAPEDSDSMFSNMPILETISFNNFKTDKVTSMQSMFAYDTNLSNIDGMSSWNVEKVDNMSFMFAGCVNITTIDLSGWHTTSLYNMQYMFAMMNNYLAPITNAKLEEIIISDKFDTSNVVSMVYAFYYNNNLKDHSFLQYFNTDNVIRMDFMFTRNYGLTNLDIFANWNVENVTTMTSMFSGCTNMTDASGINDWDINPNASFNNMFKNVPVHPEFTKVSGTWNTGTFTPTT